MIARTELGRERRIVLGGHLDTVPANGNEVPRLDGDVLHGLGSADMKGGLAVLLRLAEEISAGREPRFDCTLAFYEGEEIADEFNGLRHVFAERPELLAGDFAVLLEPTGDHIEAGCQGTLHLRAHFEGERAHSARPWKGRNAIYAAADVLERLAAHEADTVLVDGLPYRESLQVVRIEGGVANNVVPDECTIVVNRRFAPKYSVDEARAQVEKLLEGADRVEVINASPAAPPNLGHPLAAEFVGGPRPRRRAEAGLDGRRPLRVPRHPGRELRARRSRRGPHRRRAGHPGVGRAVLRRVRPVPRPCRLSGAVTPCGERSPLSRRSRTSSGS